MHRHVILVTVMWKVVPNDTGEARENELSGEFLKPALGRGVQMARHRNTPQSTVTHPIIQKITANHPVSLQIQREQVRQRKNLVDSTYIFAPRLADTKMALTFYVRFSDLILFKSLLLHRFLEFDDRP